MDVFDLAAKITLDTSGLESGISSAKNSFQGLSSMAVAAGNAIYDMAKSAAQSLGSLAKSVVEVGSSFDSSMANVAAISGAAGDELDSLRDKAKEMGATTKFSASEAADAFSYMAMAGWKTEDMLSGIDGIMSLAAASGEDLATTSDIVTDALTAFGLAAEDSGRFADILAAASSNANTNVSMMGETFKYVAPLAGTLGYSAEDMAVAIGLMANSGIKASQAGTSLRSALTRLISPTDEAASLIADFGISLTDADGNMLPFSDTVAALRTAFAGLSESEQASAAATLFGQEAMSGMLAIINAAPEDVSKLTEAVENSGGAAEEMASVMEDNVGGAMTTLNSALEGLGIALYETFSDDFKSVITFASDSISKLTEAFGENGLQGALEVAGEIVGGIVKKMADKFFELTGINLEPVINVFTAIGDSVKTLAEAFADGGISGVVSELVESIKNATGIDLKPIVDGIKSFVDNFSSSAMDSLKRFADIIRTMFENFKDSALADGIKNVVIAIGDFIIKIGEIASSALEKIVGWIEALVTNFDKWAPLISGVATAILIFAGAMIAMEIIQNAKTWIDNFKTSFGALNKVMSANPILLIISLIAGLVVALVEAYKTNDEFRKKVDEAWAAILKAASDIKDAFVEFFTKTIPNALSDAVKALKDRVQDFVDAGANLLKGLWEGIKGAVDWVIDGVKGIGKSIVDAVKGIFDEHSPSRVMMKIGAYLMDGLRIGVLDEGKKVENDIASAFESMIPSNLSTSVDFSSSSVGKSSAAMVNGIMASASDGGTYNINLNVDGRTLASVLFDPLNNVAQQKGVLIGNA